jgi:hypothetical protein
MLPKAEDGFIVLLVVPIDNAFIAFILFPFQDPENAQQVFR